MYQIHPDTIKQLKNAIHHLNEAIATAERLYNKVQLVRKMYPQLNDQFEYNAISKHIRKAVICPV